jgi:hypothetical protein
MGCEDALRAERLRAAGFAAFSGGTKSIRTRFAGRAAQTAVIFTPFECATAAQVASVQRLSPLGTAKVRRILVVLVRLIFLACAQAEAKHNHQCHNPQESCWPHER